MTAQNFAQQFSFGSGFLYGLPTGGTVNQPVLLGTLQDCSYDISSSIKELYGQLQFPVAIGRGEAKFTGKAKMGSFSSVAWNTFFFGPGSDNSALPTQSAGANAISIVDKEIGSTSSNTYQFVNHAAATADPAGNLAINLGVYYSTTGLYLQQVASAPAIGQYSYAPSTGTWTFNASDTAANAANGITVAYSWLPTTPTHWVQQINNNAFPMGAAPAFQIEHHIPYTTGGTDTVIKIWNAVSSKLSFGFKNSDFTIPEIDFTMFANTAGKIIDISTTY